MKYPAKIILKNETRLQISDNEVTCWDTGNRRVALTPAHQKIIRKLAGQLNAAVSMDELYRAYANPRAAEGSQTAWEKMVKEKATIPKAVRDAIRSVRGCGYRLEGTAVENTEAAAHTPQPTAQSSGCLTDLTGDYYGFYLDQLGTGSVLGAYLHIENTGTWEAPEMTAYAVFHIRHDSVLFGRPLAEIFSRSSRYYQNAFQEFKASLRSNDRRCAWARGPVSVDGRHAVITLAAGEPGAVWTIYLDLKEHLRCKQDFENEADCFRGGLGLLLAARTADGTYCSRLGLVRREYAVSAMRLDSDQLRDRLKILDSSQEAEWKPLKLSGWLNKHWHEWIMSE